jgi:Pyrimidine dimer DNA glycosylase
VRLWTLHPKYLDARGLVALWREGLLARAVLSRKTRGYRHHPQVQRFRAHRSPLAAIDTYLRMVLLEADARGYAFDRKKIGPSRPSMGLTATQGQLDLERRHLLRKLRGRSPELYRHHRRLGAWEPHPLFRVVAGGVEAWEREGRRTRAPGARPKSQRSATRGR